MATMYYQRHFEDLAHEIKATVREVDPSERDAVYALALRLSYRFLRDNPRFDRTRFLAACEVPEDWP